MYSRKGLNERRECRGWLRSVWRRRRARWVGRADWTCRPASGRATWLGQRVAGPRHLLLLTAHACGAPHLDELSVCVATVGFCVVVCEREATH